MHGTKWLTNMQNNNEKKPKYSFLISIEHSSLTCVISDIKCTSFSYVDDLGNNGYMEQVLTNFLTHFSSLFGPWNGWTIGKKCFQIQRIGFTT